MHRQDSREQRAQIVLGTVLEAKAALETNPAPPLLPVYLIGCVAAKLTSAAKARDLYISLWFRKARAFVERTESPWLILSAQLGLVAPNDVIEPYDATLNHMVASDRRQWGVRVLDKLDRMVDRTARLIVLAGRRYRDPLWHAIGHRASVPMQGLGIGQQLAWLSRHA